MNASDITHIIDSLKSVDRATWAFDWIIERYTERLYWHIRRIVVLHEDAQDALQDTFVVAYSSASAFRGETEGSLIAWLYKIATTVAIKHLRRRRKHIFASVDSVSQLLLADFEGEIVPDANQISILLQRAIIELPVKQKLVFNMRYFDQLSFEQISQATGQSVSTLKTNYHYAVKKIKQRVTELDYEQDE